MFGVQSKKTAPTDKPLASLPDGKNIEIKRVHTRPAEATVKGYGR